MCGPPEVAPHGKHAVPFPAPNFYALAPFTEGLRLHQTLRQDLLQGPVLRSLQINFFSALSCLAVASECTQVTTSHTFEYRRQPRKMYSWKTPKKNMSRGSLVVQLLSRDPLRKTVQLAQPWLNQKPTLKDQAQKNLELLNYVFRNPDLKTNSSQQRLGSRTCTRHVHSSLKCFPQQEQIMLLSQRDLRFV